MLIQERPPLRFDLTLLNSEWAYLWEEQWLAFTGTTLVDFTADIQNVQLGTNATVEFKPAIQFAATRIDRPDDGARISAGSVVTGNGVHKWQETPSGASKQHWRQGLAFRLASGSFARAQVKLRCCYRQAARILAAEEFTVNPTNSTTDWSIFAFGGEKPIPALGVDKLKYAVLGMGNANSALEFQPAVRTYKDPLARGDWTLLGSVSNPASGDFDVNTGEVAFTGITLADHQYLDLGLAVRKATGGSANSRCHFRVLPALKLS